MAEACRFDIIIVGAGIAGSALAVALGGRGLAIALVEAQSLQRPELPLERGLAHFDPRVSAITPRSKKFLGDLGAWEAVASYRQCAYRHMTVWDAEGTGGIEFDCSDVNAAELGHIAENRALVNALLDRIADAPDITTFSEVRLEECRRDDRAATTGVRLEDGTVLEAALVVAADGALSPVRDMMGFATREWDYGHRAIVTTAQVENSHRDTCWQRFLTSGPLAFLPLPGDHSHHFCSIVWSVQKDPAGQLMQLDDEAFSAELESAIEGRLGRVLACSRRFAFPLRQRHAVDYVQPGVALVADAAHTIHPLAGQGINLGLQDVAVLAEEILAGRARGVSPGQLSLLRRYQRRRKGENLLMMAAMDGFKALFEQQALPLRWLRNAGMRSVGQMGPLKQQLIRRAMGVG